VTPATKSRNQLKILRAQSFAAQPWLMQGFSTRCGGFSEQYGGGALNLGFTSDDPAKTVERNRSLFLRSLEATRSTRLVTLKQIHSDIIHFIEEAPEAPLNGDGILTRTPGVLLGIQTADCLPVLIADPEKNAVGAFHAGWRGTLARIVEKGVGAMRARFGSDPRKMIAAIGPGIHQCCYAVGDEVIDLFRTRFAYADDLFKEVYDTEPVRMKYPMLFLTARAPGHSNIGPQIHLDLAEANRRQLLDAGLSAGNIEVMQHCTSCNTGMFFSHRGEHGWTGRMLAVVGVR
jgi:polyphenol oxidase